jgi:tetratricopeptide (TPR) repeat protein
VYRRSVNDLERLPAPPATATDDEARTYVSVRARLAFLYLLQSRVDAEAEKAGAGTAKARTLAEEAVQLVPTYKSLMTGDMKAPNLDGWEARLAAEDSRTRAVYLEGINNFAAGKYDEVFASAGKVLAEMNEHGPLTETVKGVEGTDDAQKARVGKLAEGVDKLRRDLVVLSLKTRVQQGQADKGIELLDLLKKFGGTIESSRQTLEQLTLDMSGRIEKLRREGKAAEAKTLSDGFAKLLERVSAEPNLPVSMQLFLGQALIVVGKYDEAAAALAKVPRPANIAMPADEAARVMASQYRRAALDTARAKRMGKKYDEAEKLIAEAMGTKEKQGWAFSSLDFRKESAYLNEARGADEKNPKEAGKHWGTAVKSWNEMLTITRNRMTGPPPKDATGNLDNNAIQKGKNAFYDAYFDYNRCILKANMQLLAGNPKLDERMADTAKRFVELETKEGANMYPEVRGRYHDLITEVPALRQSYEKLGGKLFLQAPEG